MIFSSPSFIFIFLPFVFVLFRLFRPGKVRNIFLACVSLLFYAFGSLSAVPVFIGSILMNYFAGRLLLLVPVSYKKPLVILSVFANILILVLFKYVPPVNNILPLGISFFTFQGISYIVDISRGKAHPADSFLTFFLYISFFPRLISGPIVEYHDFENQVSESEISPQRSLYGILRFVIGFSKKMLIASSVARIADVFFDSSFLSASPVIDFRIAWIGAIAYAIQIYFDFSGYSDMAIGLSAMFGFSVKENFDLPYSSFSIREFWRRWHISLSSWFRDYLYIPLGGSRKGKARTYLNRMLVFLCTGIWHGNSLTFLVWGMLHGILSNLEDAEIIPVEKLKKTFPGRIICRIYTILCVVVLFVIFRCDSLFQAGKVILSMFSFRITTIPTEILKTVNPGTVFFLLTGILFSGRLALNIRVRTANKFSDLSVRSVTVIAATVIMFLFVLSLMSMASGGFSPFIYFKF